MKNIERLTKSLNGLQETIDDYQEQLNILNNEDNSYSYFKFVMSAKMSSYGSSEMPSNDFDLPYELTDAITKMYKEWLEKEIKKAKDTREELVKNYVKEQQ